MKKILTIVLALFAAVGLLAVILKYAPNKQAISPNKQEIAKPKAEKVVEAPISKETLAQYKKEAANYQQNIETYKVRLNNNIQKLSNKKWLNRSYEDLTGISPEDLKIIQDNNSVVYYMQAAYLSLATIKVTYLKDKDGAAADLSEFKKIVKSNKYVVQSDEIIRVIDNFSKKWDL